MFLERMKTTDFDPKKKYTFVISMGATEQHGPFLPLGTDSYLQEAIVAGAEKKTMEAVFLPTLRITCSKEHEGFPGSIWIEKETMKLVLRDLCQSVLPYAANIILVSWHGGNISLLNRFVEEYRVQLSPVHLEHISLDSDEILKKTSDLLEGPVDEHAGNSETSMMLACEEELTMLPPNDYPKRKIKNAWDTDRLVDVSRDGIVDNHPKWIITKEIGEACIDMAAKELATHLKRVMATK